MQFLSFTSIAALLATTATTAPVSSADSELMALAKRQTSNPCSIWTPQTRLVGDGSPKDWWLWKQITGEMRCGNADVCSIGEGEYQSWTIGASLGGGTSWISGGLAVEKSWETGTTWTCEATEGKKVCIWLKIAHTEYEVQDGSYNSCGGFSPGKKYKITSPKKNNAGGYHECSTTDCRVEGTQYWVDK